MDFRRCLLPEPGKAMERVFPLMASPVAQALQRISAGLSSVVVMVVAHWFGFSGPDRGQPRQPSDLAARTSHHFTGARSIALNKILKCGRPQGGRCFLYVLGQRRLIMMTRFAIAALLIVGLTSASFAAGETAGVSMPVNGPHGSSGPAIGTVTAPSIGSYNWPSVGVTNAVPTWSNTNPK
jgi:hypothetical protein